MKKKKLWKKLMSAALSTAMVAALVPVSALAVTGDQVAADGTYTKKVTVINDSEDEDDWDNYDATVSLTVKDGVFTDVSLSGGGTSNATYVGYVLDGRTRKGVTYDGLTSLVGKAATYTNVDGWNDYDTVSGATCTYNVVKEAVLELIQNADEAEPEKAAIDTSELAAAIAEAELLVEDDYTADSWNAFAAALSAARAVVNEAESQDAVDEALSSLQSAMNALEEAAEEYVYVTMNVPYTEFYAAYDYDDAAIWEVADGIDAVSTATTSKFLGTTGLAKGTYNNGTYIMGVTLPVKVSESVLEELGDSLTTTDDYYYVILEEEPEVYSTLTVNSNGGYSFSALASATIDTSYLSVDELTLTGGYGDYQVSLVGFDTSNGIQAGESEYISDYTIYGAILNTSAGDYAMTCLENLWYGTRVDYVEIAWSIAEGQQLQRAHGSGGLFYQFSGMNGATLTSVTVITSLGVITVPAANGGIVLTKYYDGDTSELVAAITNNSDRMTISGIPSDLEDVTITVDGLATDAVVEDGSVQLDSYPEDGVQYTVTISSSNYPDITTTVSTPISALQIAELEKWMALAEVTDGYDSNTDLQEHVAEAEELIANADATSYEAATLIDELISKVKATYTNEVAATATLAGSILDITLSGAAYSDLENPTYTLTYSSGRNSMTLTSGSLTGLTVLLEDAPTVGTTYTLTIVSDNYADITASVTAEAAEEITYRYITMNVPYTDFYAAYGLTDAAVWEVEDGLDAVSTATTSKFLGTTGLANGTYNDGTYILGVTLTVAVSEEDYAELETELTVNDSYYYVDLEEAPEIYSVLLIDSEGNYSFSKYQTSDVSTDNLSVEEYTITGGYGDYQISLVGVGTDMTLDDGTESGTTYGAIYGAILTTTDGGSYGMTALENLWYGTRVDYVEIAWSIVEGQGLCRAHGSGDPYYQFENMNGATLNSVILITDVGVITIDCNQQLDEYYDGDTSALAVSITNDSIIMTISGIPSDLEDVTITVDGLVTDAAVVDGEVQLDSYPEDGVQYTVTISSSNYPDITLTVSTSIAEEQKEELQKWMDAAKALDEYASSTDLQEHVAEAEELIANADATSYEAAELIDELMSKVKAYYPTATATATLEGRYLTVSFDEIELDDLVNPTYTLSYRSGRNTVTLTSGDLDALRVRLQEDPTVGTEYTLTIVSDNYQDITVSVTAEEATIETASLEAAIETAEALTESNYTAESWETLEAALAAAKAALEAGESQVAVDEATAALLDAINALEVVSEETVDTSALEAAIETAEALAEGDYTAESWAALEAALTAAKENLSASESQSAVDAATLALNTAMDSLVKTSASTDDTGSGDDDSTDGTGSDNGDSVGTGSDNGNSTGTASGSDDSTGTTSNSGSSTNTTSDDSSSTGSGSATGSSSASTSSSATATGDSTDLWIWLMLALAAVAVGGVAVKRRRELR